MEKISLFFDCYPRKNNRGERGREGGIGAQGKNIEREPPGALLFGCVLLTVAYIFSPSLLYGTGKQIIDHHQWPYQIGRVGEEETV